MVTLRQQKKLWHERLEQAGVFAPAFELVEILAAAGWDRAEQIRGLDQPVPPERVQAVERILEERCAGRPLQYILGCWEFYGLEFFVGEGVLIPRADTETLVEAGLRLLHGREAPLVADLCSGSGCVAVALAKQRPDARVTAVELSPEAFSYLQKNIRHHHAANVEAWLEDALEAWKRLSGLDLIVSNPPYIPTGELDGLQREVRREPRMALDGSGDGLSFYRELTRLYHDCLRPDGWLCYEVGDNQWEDVSALLRENGYGSVGCWDDLAGFHRVVYGQRQDLCMGMQRNLGRETRI